MGDDDRRAIALFVGYSGFSRNGFRMVEPSGFSRLLPDCCPRPPDFAWVRVGFTLYSSERTLAHATMFAVSVPGWSVLLVWGLELPHLVVCEFEADRCDGFR